MNYTNITNENKNSLLIDKDINFILNLMYSTYTGNSKSLKESKEFFDKLIENNSIYDLEKLFYVIYTILNSNILVNKNYNTQTICISNSTNSSSFIPINSLFDSDNIYNSFLSTDFITKNKIIIILVIIITKFIDYSACDGNLNDINSTSLIANAVENSNNILSINIKNYFNQNGYNSLVLLLSIKGFKNSMLSIINLISKLCVYYPSSFQIDSLIEFIMKIIESKRIDNNDYSINSSTFERIFEEYRLLFLISELMKVFVNNKDIKFNEKNKENIYSVMLKLLSYQAVIVDIFINDIANIQNVNIINLLIIYFNINKNTILFLNQNLREEAISLTMKIVYYILKLDPKILSDVNLTNLFFISIKIIIKYTSVMEKVTLNTIKSLAELFYSFSVNESFISMLKNSYINDNCNNNYNNNNYICNNNNNNKHYLFIKDNFYYRLKDSNEYYEKIDKFLIAYLTFIKELVQMMFYDNYKQLSLFSSIYSSIYSDEKLLINNYLSKEFFLNSNSNNRLDNIISFIIKNCLCISNIEIEKLETDEEEYYVYMDSLSIEYNIREKAAFLLRLLFNRFKTNDEFCTNKNINNEDTYNYVRDFININLDQRIINIINYFNTNNNNITSKERLSLDIERSCIYSVYDSLAYLYFDYDCNNKIDVKSFIFNVLLQNFDNSFKIYNKYDYITKYLSIRIIGKIIDYLNNEDKPQVYYIIFDIFKNYNNLLIKLTCIDFFFFYFDMPKVVEYHNNDNSLFIKYYVNSICYLFQNITSPDLQNKLIKTTSSIISNYKKQQVRDIIDSILPTISSLWTNNKNIINNEQNNNFNSMSGLNISFNENNNKIYNTSFKNNNNTDLRKNLISLVTLFIKKVNVFSIFKGNIQESNIDFYMYDFTLNIIFHCINHLNDESSFFIKDGIYLILTIFDQFYVIEDVESNFKSMIANSYFNNDFISCISNNNNSYNMSMLNHYSSNINFQAFLFQLFKLFSNSFDLLLNSIAYNDDNYIYQLINLENYISLTCFNEVKLLFIKHNYFNKIKFIINKIFNNIKCIKYISFPIFNFIEFNLLCFNSLEFNKNLNNINNSNVNIPDTYLDLVNDFNEFCFDLSNRFLQSSNIINLSIEIYNMSNYDINVLNNLINSYFNEDTSYIIGSIQIFNRIIDILIQKNNDLNNLTRIFNIDFLYKILKLVSLLLMYDELRYIKYEIEEDDFDLEDNIYKDNIVSFYNKELLLLNDNKINSTNNNKINNKLRKSSTLETINRIVTINKFFRDANIFKSNNNIVDNKGLFDLNEVYVTIKNNKLLNNIEELDYYSCDILNACITKIVNYLENLINNNNNNINNSNIQNCLNISKACISILCNLENFPTNNKNTFDKYNKILSNRLFLFNKITSNIHDYKLTATEDFFKKKWIKKLENTHLDLLSFELEQVKYCIKEEALKINACYI